jgi:hypothetical protein
MKAPPVSGFIFPSGRFRVNFAKMNHPPAENLPFELRRRAAVVISAPQFPA